MIICKYYVLVYGMSTKYTYKRRGIYIYNILYIGVCFLYIYIGKQN